MRQRIDIREVEVATKIRAKYLRALENEEYDLLPGPTFVRSFLKTYADYLGLDARLLIEEFRDRYEPPREEETPAFTPPTPPRGGRGENPGPPGRGTIVVGAIVAVIGLLLVLGLTGEEEEGPADRSGNTAAERPTTGNGDRARERRRARARRARERRSRAERTPRTVRLRVAPGAEATYACVDRGADPPVFEGTLTGARTFTGQRLRLNLGRPSTRVTVNGDRVRIAEGSDPVGFEFRPGRRPQPLPVGRRPCA